MADEPYTPSPIGNPSVLARRNWWQTQLVLFIGKHTPKCREMVQILSKSLDEPLPLSMRIKKRMHFLICCWCQRYEEQLQYMRKASRKLAEHADEPAVSPVPNELKARWKRALRDEPLSAQSTPTIEQHVHESRGRVVPRGTWNRVFLAAAAAVLMAAVLFWMKPPRARVSLADYRDEMVSFIKVPPNLELRSSSLSDVNTWMKSSRGPAEFTIPQRVLNHPAIGCRVLRYGGRDVTLVCFRRAEGGLVHLFVIEGSAIKGLPERGNADIAQQREWVTAAWSDARYDYLLAVQGDRAMIKSLLADR